MLIQQDNVPKTFPQTALERDEWGSQFLPETVLIFWLFLVSALLPGLVSLIVFLGLFPFFSSFLLFCPCSKKAILFCYLELGICFIIISCFLLVPALVLHLSPSFFFFHSFFEKGFCSIVINCLFFAGVGSGSGLVSLFSPRRSLFQYDFFTSSCRFYFSSFFSYLFFR